MWTELAYGISPGDRSVIDQGGALMTKQRCPQRRCQSEPLDLGLTCLAAIAASLIVLLLIPGAAGAKTKWLCRPGHSPDPCLGSLKTTVISPGGQARVVKPRNARHPKIDCFFVYGSVSTQPGPNANLHIDPEEAGIARDQASRLSQTCRVFAPMYRQITGQIKDFQTLKAAAKVAYASLRHAWHRYITHFNHGRGVVLIGHSQGSIALRKLIRNQIDGRRAVRRRVVSAILPGADVLVKKHELADGDFRHIPGCRSATETRCVIAYSTFDEPVEADSRFGRPDGPGSFEAAWGLPVRRSNVRVLCTNPASLSGGSGALDTILPTTPPTSLDAGLWKAIWNGNLPTAPTPWVTPQDHYTGKCVRSNGAHVLMLSPVGDAQHLRQPVSGFGLHFLDVELALGNLTDLVKSEAKAYISKASR